MQPMALDKADGQVPPAVKQAGGWAGAASGRSGRRRWGGHRRVLGAVHPVGPVVCKKCRCERLGHPFVPRALLSRPESVN